MDLRSLHRYSDVSHYNETQISTNTGYTWQPIRQSPWMICAETTWCCSMYIQSPIRQTRGERHHIKTHPFPPFPQVGPTLGTLWSAQLSSWTHTMGTCFSSLPSPMAISLCPPFVVPPTARYDLAAAADDSDALIAVTNTNMCEIVAALCTLGWDIPTGTSE
jgi:hypothetical protein